MLSAEREAAERAAAEASQAVVTQVVEDEMERLQADLAALRVSSSFFGFLRTGARGRAAGRSQAGKAALWFCIAGAERGEGERQSWQGSMHACMHGITPQEQHFAQHSMQLS
jgi:hypothetical protein